MRGVWPIVIALVLGVVVGLVVNFSWSGAIWSAIGIHDAAAFKEGSPAREGAPANQPGIVAYSVKFLAELGSFIGQAFVRALRMAAVPIVLFSVIAGVASLGDPRKLGRIGYKALGLFLFTSVLAVSIGLLIANVVRPGRWVSPEARELVLAGGTPGIDVAMQSASAHRTIWDYLLAMIPTNPFEALAKADMLPTIVFAMCVGALLTMIAAERAKPVIELCETMSDLMGRLVMLIMKAAPVAVFCLIAPVVAGMGLEAIRALGVYCLCVIGGLVVMMTLVYAPLVLIGARRKPAEFFKGLGPAMLVAFGTSSSNATLPVTLRCVTERVGVSKRVANFVLPLGATVNMDGTALYQGIASLFVAQAMGIDLTLSQQMMIVFIATTASIGSPGIPGGSLVFLIVVLQSVGVPASALALILAVDRLLDMCRTVVNISGDAAVTAVVARREGASLA